MKVLYISNFTDGTGYSKAACENVLALDAVGIDVVCRNVRLSGFVDQIPPKVGDLLSRNTDGVSHIVQHTLPELMAFNTGSIVNCGFFASETNNLAFTGWVNRLNRLSTVYTINRSSKYVCSMSGVKRPTYVVPHPVDITKFERSYTPIPELKHVFDNNFVFYTIGECITRKDLVSLLKAFHITFSYGEPVELLIKTSIPGLPPEEAFRRVEEICRKVKEGLRLHRDLSRYKREVIVTSRMSEEQINSLHYHSHCYISTSRGEACGLAALTSMGFGKTPILSDIGGHSEYCSPAEGYMIPVRNEPCMGADNTSPWLHNGYDQWQSVDIMALSEAMRLAYTNKDLNKRKAAAGIEKINEFSYENIGKRFAESLQTL